MNPLPIYRLRWKDHLSALWWLGLLYRRPQQFRDALSTCSVKQQPVTAFWLLLHSAPYVFALSAAGYSLETSLIGSEFRIEHLAVGIAIGIAVGLAFGLTGSLASGLAGGIAGGIAFGIAGGIAGGIARGIASGIHAGIASGLAGGLAGEIAGGFALGIVVGIAFGIASGIAGGFAGGFARGIIFGCIVGLAGGIAGGLASWLAFGITSGIASGIIFGGIIGLAGGIAGGLVFGIAFGIFSGFAGGIASGIAFGLAGGLAGWLAFGTASGIALGIASGIAFVISSTRIYYQLVHLAFVWPSLNGRRYPRHPVAWDDLCTFPFPGLDRLLVDYAEKAPEAGVAEIERLISNYPSQRVMALRARVRLLARQAGMTADLVTLDEILKALPEGEKGFLAQTGLLRAGVHEIVALQSRLNTIDRPVLRELFARLLRKEIENFRHRIGGFHEPLATEFRMAADQWLKIAEKQLREAQAVVKKVPVPQVFRAGVVVDRENEAFVPRDSVVSSLERQVLLDTGCPGIVLYGRRRVGKSTTLRNLSGFLPPTVQTVNFYPEAFTSLDRLVRHLIREVSTVFLGERLPSQTQEGLKGLFDFLSACNQILETDDRRLVISMDEYENIDQKIGKGVFSEDLLATFRESIQSHRRITWLFAGSHEITELLNAPWTSYFVSARTIEVPMFSEQETRLLLTEPFKYSSLWRDDPAHPRPRFEPRFWGEGGIERIHAEAGGWPHLIQLIAEILIDLLNDEGGQQVTPALMERALDRAIVSAHNLLDVLLLRESELPPGQWEYLSNFRSHDTQPPPDDEAIVQSLHRRLLVEEAAGQWRLRVPLMSRWLRKQGYAIIEQLISSDPSQQVMALRSQVKLLARQARETVDLANLDEVVAALPEGEKGFLAQTGLLRAGVHEIVALQRRLDAMDRPYLRELHAQLLHKQIENLRYRIGGFHEPLATEFRMAADQWLKIAEKQLREAQAVVKKAPVLQVFRAGDPVDRENEAFVPRDSVVGDLQEQVLLSTGCPGVVLYGRRRVGKSTTLRNLSGFLPPTVQTVNLSMQNPEAFTSLDLFINHLVREVSRVFTLDKLPVETSKDLRDLFGFSPRATKFSKGRTDGY